MIIKNCPACRTYNVFGFDDKPCCFKEMKYCEDVDDCLMKKFYFKLRDLECDQPMIDYFCIEDY